MSDWIPLADAVSRFRVVSRGSSSYATYSSHAARCGSVTLGRSIETKKDSRGRWVVRESEVEAGIAAEIIRTRQIREATEKYEEHTLIGSPGQRVHTEWGHYVVAKDFHFHYSFVDAYRRRNDGFWICSQCWTRATEKHEKAECHTCSDWGDCRRNCTLSSIGCDECGTEMSVSSS